MVVLGLIHRSVAFMDHAMIRFVCVLSIALLMGSVPAADAPLKVLFLGDQGHHKPAERFAQLEPVLATRGIDLVYT